MLVGGKTVLDNCQIYIIYVLQARRTYFGEGGLVD